MIKDLVLEQRPDTPPTTLNIALQMTMQDIKGNKIQLQGKELTDYMVSVAVQSIDILRRIN